MKNKTTWVGEDGRALQPIEIDASGTARFRKNEIVRFLLDQGPFTMTTLACKQFSKSDQAQFAQLIGYSVSGFGDLSYALQDQVIQADKEAAKIKPKA